MVEMIPDEELSHMIHEAMEKLISEEKAVKLKPFKNDLEKAMTYLADLSVKEREAFLCFWKTPAAKPGVGRKKKYGSDHERFLNTIEKKKRMHEQKTGKSISMTKFLRFLFYTDDPNQDKDKVDAKLKTLSNQISQRKSIRF